MNEQAIMALRSLAQQIEAWRLGRGLSRNQICQRYGQLGSSKTYGRILDVEDGLAQLDVAVQTANYQAAWELLQVSKDDPEANRIYSDFEWVRAALVTVTEALDEPGISRLVLITGGTGAGKSTILDLLDRHPITKNITYRVEATEAWRESTNELLGALLTEVGAFERATDDAAAKSPTNALPLSPGARLRKLVERINGRRVILSIDESHHIGPAGYNIVKTIINQTRAVVVMTAMPELIARINRASHAEAAQLFQNRLFEHVRLTRPEAGDVLEFCKRRGSSSVARLMPAPSRPRSLKTLLAMAYGNSWPDAVRKRANAPAPLAPRALQPPLPASNAPFP